MPKSRWEDDVSCSAMEEEEKIVQLVSCTGHVEHVELCFCSTCMCLLGTTLF